MAFIKLRKDKPDCERVGMYIKKDTMNALRELSSENAGETITSIVQQFIDYCLELVKSGEVEFDDSNQKVEGEVERSTTQKKLGAPRHDDV